VLGIEAVLADGRVLHGLKALRKDNTGYDLKQLFIGAEGTLGVITSAALKLFPRPRRYDTAFVALASPQAAVDLLALLRRYVSNSVIAFEIMPEIALQFVTKHMGATRPLREASLWYVLAELADAAPDAMNAALEEALSEGLISDAAIALNEGQRLAFWAVRENLSDSQKFEGGSIKHDVSVPVSRIPVFIDEAMTEVEASMPGCRYLCFGHIGDGNIHFNVSQPIGMDRQRYLARWKEMSDIVHAVVLKHGGSISAEHGVGRLKRDEMRMIKSPVELAVMRSVKALFDPTGIMNPGKVLPD
jgi:FAD/FMN-containing dehydrogenase